jgi:hypothetical protein
VSRMLTGCCLTDQSMNGCRGIDSARNYGRQMTAMTLRCSEGK